MIRVEAVIAIFGYVLILVFLGVAFYFVWFKPDSYQCFMNRFIGKIPMYGVLVYRVFGSYMKTKGYVRDQRIAITAAFVFVIAIGLAVLLPM